MQLDNLIDNTIDNLKNVINTSNVIGTPIKVDGKTIVPVSKVTFGFVTGGAEYSAGEQNESDELPYASGSGGGVNIVPIGFLMCENDDYKFIKVSKNEGEDKWTELIEATMRVLKDKKKR